MSRYLILAVACLFFIGLSAKESKAAQTMPTLNNGNKWRIAYLEGGPYVNYQGSLKSTVQNLMDMGWIEKADIPESSDMEETKSLWTWLSRKAQSPYLTFLKDAYWSSRWKREKRASNVEEIKERMATAKDIDLFIGMGTWAGQDLVAILDETPLIVMSSSNPVRSKIVKSSENSGKENVLAWCDPTRGERRIRLFHDILGFKRLGIIYEDSKEGRVYASLSPTKKVAEERGFHVVECHAAASEKPIETCKEDVSRCIEKIKSRIDALVVSNHRGFHPKYFPDIIKPLLDERIPVFTTIWGPDLVRRGVLMGIARQDYGPLGRFYANSIAKILNGAKPGDLEQIYKEPLRLAINLESARTIGYKIPPNVKQIADILYDHTERTPLD